MTFLPKNYEIPQAPSDYMKFVKGENRFRILDNATTGFEYWTQDSKPVRSKEPFEETPNIKIENGRQTDVKAFWAIPVWNYNSKSVQILEITQVSIMSAIKALYDNSKWGSPVNYDICVTKTGEKMETKYQVTPEPPIEEPSQEIKDAYVMKTPNLEALFANDGKGGDPFAPL